MRSSYPGGVNPALDFFILFIGYISYDKTNTFVILSNAKDPGLVKASLGSFTSLRTTHNSVVIFYLVIWA